MIGQALQAAQRSAEGKDAHSLHAYFMRAGDDALPIIYRVVRDFDGKSFATRRVIATQNGQPILNMAASFQVAEDGLHHQDAFPADMPPPEELKSEANCASRSRDAHARRTSRASSCAGRARSTSARSIRATGSRRSSATRHSIAGSAPLAPLGDDPAMHRAILAYASRTWG